MVVSKEGVSMKPGRGAWTPSPRPSTTPPATSWRAPGGCQGLGPRRGAGALLLLPLRRELPLLAPHPRQGGPGGGSGSAWGRGGMGLTGDTYQVQCSTHTYTQCDRSHTHPV